MFENEKMKGPESTRTEKSLSYRGTQNLCTIIGTRYPGTQVPPRVRVGTFFLLVPGYTVPGSTSTK